MCNDRQLSLMILAALPGLGPVNIRRLDAAIEGGVEQLLSMTREERRLWVPERVVTELEGWRKFLDPEKVAQSLEALGADFITCEGEHYPNALRHFGDRPVGLYRCRAGKRLPDRTIAIVGTRKPSTYGRKVAREFAQELGLSGFCIVSGLAEGIDTEAHRAALDSDCLTSAVLGGGLNRCYPVSNRGLMEEIKDSGGVWTEFPLWRSADRRSFPQRNRIVAGMSEAVLVIESGTAGGSLITARMASEQGKPVYVVPGRIDAPESMGCHALIRDGAQLVTSVDEVLQDLNYLPGLLKAASSGKGPVKGARRHRSTSDLTEAQVRIWDFLSNGSAAHVDSIAEGLGISAAQASGMAMEMEITGFLCRRLDGCYEQV